MITMSVKVTDGKVVTMLTNIGSRENKQKALGARPDCVTDVGFLRGS